MDRASEENPELWTKIQMNPAIQKEEDKLELIEALRCGFIQNLATDHALPIQKKRNFQCF